MFQLKEGKLEEIKTIIESDSDLLVEYKQIVSNLVGLKTTGKNENMPDKKALIKKRCNSYPTNIGIRVFVGDKIITIRSDLHNHIYQILKKNGPLMFDNIFEKLPSDYKDYKNLYRARCWISNNVKTGLFVVDKQNRKRGFSKYGINPNSKEV